MTVKRMIASMFVFIFLVACSAGVDDAKDDQGQEEKEQIKQLVNDYSLGNVSSLRASITSHQLIVTNSDKTETIYQLPEDEFFVSIAPFIDQTHP